MSEGLCGVLSGTASSLSSRGRDDRKDGVGTGMLLKSAILVRIRSASLTRLSEISHRADSGINLTKGKEENDNSYGEIYYEATLCI